MFCFDENLARTCGPLNELKSGSYCERLMSDNNNEYFNELHCNTQMNIKQVSQVQYGMRHISLQDKTKSLKRMF